MGLGNSLIDLEKCYDEFEGERQESGSELVNSHNFKSASFNGVESQGIRQMCEQMESLGSVLE